MAFRYNDRVRVNCTPSGLGDISLGTVPTGYLSFANGGFSDGDTTVVGIVVAATGEFVICNATYNSAGPSITRGTIIESSDNGNNVSFAGGTAGVVFVGLSATKVIHEDLTAAELFALGLMPVPSTADVTATGTIQGDAFTITTNHAYITGGGANTGVILRIEASDPIGTEKVIVNKTASAKILYPGSGDQIESDGADIGTSLGVGTVIRLKRTGATQWRTS
jgi:hypothetical protein